MKYNFSNCRKSAAAFAWDESNSGRRVKLVNIAGDWVVTVTRDKNNRANSVRG